MVKLIVIALLLSGFVGLGVLGVWMGDYDMRACSVLDGENGCGIQEDCEEHTGENCEEMALEECEGSYEECREDMHEYCDHEY